MIFRPEDRAELASWLHARESPFAVRGTQERQGGDQVIMAGLNRLILYEPGEMVVQVEAGMTIADLDAHLARHNQWIPTLQPNENESTTIGGALSLDIHHPRIRKHISLRTTVLGGTFCTSDGQLFRSGSRVVKSVAGYDTHRAFVGAHGRFGVIVEVTLRVFPRAEALYRFTAPLSLADRIRDEGPSVLEKQDTNLLVELAGYSVDIDQSRARLGNLPMMGDPEWSTEILKIRRRKSALNVASGDAGLMTRLEAALDPKGVLRG